MLAVVSKVLAVMLVLFLVLEHNLAQYQYLRPAAQKLRALFHC